MLQQSLRKHRKWLSVQLLLLLSTYITTAYYVPSIPTSSSLSYPSSSASNRWFYVTSIASPGRSNALPSTHFFTTSKLQAKTTYSEAVDELDTDSGSQGDSISRNSYAEDLDYEDGLEEISEEELEEAKRLVFDDNHYQTVNQLVTEAVESEWDYRNGVTMTRSSKSKGKPVIDANIQLWSYYARESFLKGDYQDALTLYLKCIDYDKTNGRGWLGKSKIEWKRGRKDQAEETLREGLTFAKKEPHLMQTLANIYYKTGRATDAKKLLQSAVSIQPNHAASWLLLATIHLRQSDFAAAKFCYESGLEHTPQSYALWQGYGSLELQVGNYQEAKVYFEKAVSISKKCAHAWHGLFVIEKKLRQFYAAEEVLDRALEHLPQNSRFWQAKGELAIERGDIQQARICFEQGSMFAMKCGDGGYFQSWAILERRQLETVQYQLTKYIMRKYGIERKDGLYQEEYLYDYRLMTIADVVPLFEYHDKKSIEALNAYFTLPGNDVVYLQHAYSGLSKEQVEGLAKDMVVKRLVLAIVNQIKITRNLFYQAIEVNRFHVATWHGWASLEYKLGMITIARKLLLTGISNFQYSKNIGWLHSKLAQVSLAEGDLETARACHGRALSTTPPNRSLPVLKEYINMEIKYGSRKQVKTLLELALRRFPKDEKFRALELRYT